MRLKLTGQPFQVLAILLEHPGEVVTREQLQKRRWPDTFVGIGHNLNTAINKIREALDASAEAPRFVETLPRRGYRFIGSVNHESASASVQADSERLKSDSASDAVDAVGPTTSGRFRGIGLLAAVVVLLAIAGTIIWLRQPLAAPRVLATTQLTKDGVRKVGLLTDGSRLYVLKTTGSSRFLVQASVAGGETSTIPTPFANVYVLDISPDHSQLLAAKFLGTEEAAEFWSLPLPSGPPRRIADTTGYAGSWSPDGRGLVFARGEDVYLASADGTDTRKLFTVSQGPSI